MQLEIPGRKKPEFPDAVGRLGAAIRPLRDQLGLFLLCRHFRGVGAADELVQAVSYGLSDCCMPGAAPVYGLSDCCMPDAAPVLAPTASTSYTNYCHWGSRWRGEGTDIKQLLNSIKKCDHGEKYGEGEMWGFLRTVERKDGVGSGAGGGGGRGRRSRPRAASGPERVAWTKWVRKTIGADRI